MIREIIKDLSRGGDHCQILSKLLKEENYEELALYKEAYDLAGVQFPDITKLSIP